ncbi:MAG: acetylglutamate kinase [Leptonema sp. (in: Bacteria)]|nr:acetylglutamate kinase [Leptonema sp. (in: bacteria)]
MAEEVSQSRRAEILLEALPYIQRFSGKTIVIKYGGAAQSDNQLRVNFARDIVLLKFVGIHPVVVHGGGPQITKMLDTLQIPTQFIDGHRVTDSASMDIVEMMLSGLINKEIVSMIVQAGGLAVGISGKDAGLALAKPHHLIRSNQDGTTEEVSLGQVGTIERIDPTLIQSMIQQGYIPVIAPVSADAAGRSMNINADTMAGEIASALKADKLILLTDTAGVLQDNQVLTGLTPNRVRELIRSNVISGGMIPKVECCLSAISHGVSRTHIIDGRIPHSLLLEVFTDSGVGTLITSELDEQT